MIENITRHIPLTTIIVSYFFICGGVYLIGFWTTFNVDITPLVSIADIPKSFLFPFVASHGFFVVNMLTQLVISDRLADIKDNELTENKIKTKWKKLILTFVSIDFFIIYALILLTHYYYRYKLTPEYWLISCCIFIFLVSFKYNNLPSFIKLIPYKNIRMYIVNIVISVPLLSFAIGKSNSLNIYNNHNHINLKIISANSQSLNSKIRASKFIGFLGDKVIISSLDNKELIFINQSSFDQIHLNVEK